MNTCPNRGIEVVKTTLEVAPLDRDLMGKFLAYIFLAVFGALILFASLMVAVIPQALVTDANSTSHYTAYYLLWSVLALLTAYLGMFFLIRKTPFSYLATRYGYGKVVRLGFVLHMVMGFVFAFAVLGGELGPFALKLLVLFLLFGPFPARALWLTQQRDKQYDNFLLEHEELPKRDG